MSVQIESKGPNHLLALGLSQQALQRVYEMRQACWKASGNISFLALPPLIPLLWSNTSFTPFEQVKLPLLPKQCTFSQIIEENQNLFLKTEEAEWLFIVDKIVAQYVPSEVLTKPFPAFPGIYLGANCGPKERLFSPVTTNDWRLVYFQVEWETQKEQGLVALRYEVISNRHLLTR